MTRAPMRTMTRRNFLSAAIGAVSAATLAGCSRTPQSGAGTRLLTATDVHVKDYPTVTAVRWIGETLQRETGGIAINDERDVKRLARA